MRTVPQGASVLPAAPGWGVLTPVSGEDGMIEEVSFDAIVGWLVTYGPRLNAPDDPVAEVYPLTVEGVAGEDSWLQQPDGRVVQPFAAWLDDADALVRHLNRGA